MVGADLDLSAATREPSESVREKRPGLHRYSAIDSHRCPRRGRELRVFGTAPATKAPKARTCSDWALRLAAPCTREDTWKRQAVPVRFWYRLHSLSKRRNEQTDAGRLCCSFDAIFAGHSLCVGVSRAYQLNRSTGAFPPQCRLWIPDHGVERRNSCTATGHRPSVCRPDLCASTPTHLPRRTPPSLSLRHPAASYRTTTHQLRRPPRVRMDPGRTGLTRRDRVHSGLRCQLLCQPRPPRAPGQ